MELTYQRAQSTTFTIAKLRTLSLVALTLTAVVISVAVAFRFRNLNYQDPLLLDSTVGELATWMAGQSEEDDPESILGQYARDRAESRGEDSLDVSILLNDFQNLVFVWTIGVAVLGIGGIIGLATHARWDRSVLLVALVGLDALLFIIPTIDDDRMISAFGLHFNTLMTVVIGIVLLLGVLLFSTGKVTKILGFLVILSSLLVVWEGVKAFAESNDYAITVSQSSWNYTTYPTLANTLDALAAGEVDAVIVDRGDIDEIIAPETPDADNDDELTPEDSAYPTLRYLNGLNSTMGTSFFSVEPEFPRRLGVAVRAEDANKWSSVGDFVGENVGTIAGEFADERFLSAERQLVLLDLNILTDLNLPHLQMIAEAFLQPARRNGPFLLIRILGEKAIFTWGEAALGFASGALLGFALGAFFAHSRLMERSLLPYVVASQTIPILAIAPMVVIWLGASATAVAVIAAYLTFFPVTINTLRGLTSPDPMAIELMESYAANRWTIMWKLRFPAALPYIFTALKVSATASVVGAIIGELPSGIPDGLARAILDFSSDYSLISTPKLWASIVTAAFVGIIFFVAVSVVEHFTLRRYIRSS
jgi:NitT/TauT family transport system permease protein